MKLRVDRDRLVDAVAAVGPTVPRRPSIPVLAGIRLRAEPDSASVAGFDYEISSHATITGAVVDEPGAALVSGRLLTDIAKALPPRPVELSDNGDRLEIVCGPSRFALPLMTIEDYPDLPPSPAAVGAVDHSDLRDAVAQVVVAAGRDDTLPMLTGINIEFHPSFLRLVSTDRFRIAIRELGWEPVTPMGNSRPNSMLVPARALAEASKTLTGPRIEIASDPGQKILGLATEDQHHTMRTLDMPYAPYQRYLETTHTASARIRSAPLIDAIKRVSLLSPRGTQVRLTFAATTARLSAGGDNSGSAEESIGCEFDGEPLTIAFNPRYLLEGLTAAHAEVVEISLNGPTRAAILRAAEREPHGERREGLIYVLMPVRLPD
ncbi:DNA polymerase III subunit beta [Rhodococcus sp. NPDC049939]|uniref:DNA polymerase III subunit beta n=1 Tax=Rhodococcus sp. NPDC049939 TaxID=3155511 RepID=UPI0033D1A5B7